MFSKKVNYKFNEGDIVTHKLNSNLRICILERYVYEKRIKYLCRVYSNSKLFEKRLYETELKNY